MSLFIFLTVVQAIIAAELVGIELMQRSEGGGLGIGGGGSPGGLMIARGAADFLTRTTKWLAVFFVILAIVLAAIAVNTTSGREIDDSLDRTVAPAADPLAPPAQPGQGLDQPVTGGLDQPVTGAPAEPAPASDDPLADVAQ
jgi:preprotein translocase subunit SecG